LEERVNIIKSVAETIDDMFDSIIGGRPVSRILGIAESIAPANVARRLGIPAPGELVDRVFAELEGAARSGRLPTPPSPEELRRRIFGR